MNTIIKNLKDKTYVRAFGLMTPEEQEALRKAGPLNCLFYSGISYGDNWQQQQGKYYDGTTYAIKPDYQPEPEYVDLEIVKHTQGTVVQIWWLGVWKDSHEFLPYDFTHLHCLPSLPNFECFWNKSPSPIHSENTFYCIGLVSRMRNKGHTVHARFRK